MKLRKTDFNVLKNILILIIHVFILIDLFLIKISLNIKYLLLFFFCRMKK
jgi:hypothetical protein